MFTTIACIESGASVRMDSIAAGGLDTASFQYTPTLFIDDQFDSVFAVRVRPPETQEKAPRDTSDAGHKERFNALLGAAVKRPKSSG